MAATGVDQAPDVPVDGTIDSAANRARAVTVVEQKARNEPRPRGKSDTYSGAENDVVKGFVKTSFRRKVGTEHANVSTQAKSANARWPLRHRGLDLVLAYLRLV
uniref:Uncharacterized protein n=1 Tax=Mycena chlorophos TaxID=658473 RepID=A0ABQ0M8J2_MYCCL|nr:predicted protein [Mycena chlorophos]